MKKLLFATCLMAVPAFADPLDVNGIWLTNAEDAHVEISDCGDGTPCGTLIWVDPATTDTDLDARNPDPDLRSRPLAGLPLLWGFQESSSRWRKGKIYNPEDGKTFRSAIRTRDDGTLEVKGCIGPLCQTYIWTRVETDDATEVASLSQE